LQSSKLKETPRLPCIFFQFTPTNFDSENNLDGVYSQAIKDRILEISGKDSNSREFSTRFSFVSAECFDGIQLCDILLNFTRKKIQNSPLPNAAKTLFLENLTQTQTKIPLWELYENDIKLNVRMYECTNVRMYGD